MKSWIISLYPQNSQTYIPDNAGNLQLATVTGYTTYPHNGRVNGITVCMADGRLVNVDWIILNKVRIGMLAVSFFSEVSHV